MGQGDHATRPNIMTRAELSLLLWVSDVCILSVRDPKHVTYGILKDGSCKNQCELDVTDITDTVHRLRPKKHDVSENASVSVFRSKWKRGDLLLWDLDTFHWFLRNQIQLFLFCFLLFSSEYGERSILPTAVWVYFRQWRWTTSRTSVAPNYSTPASESLQVKSVRTYAHRIRQYHTFWNVVLATGESGF